MSVMFVAGVAVALAEIKISMEQHEECIKETPNGRVSAAMRT